VAAAVFGTLKAGGFAVETMGNARANRRFLEKILAQVS